jgi:hypothetical protein
MTLQGKLQNWTWLTALSVVLAGCSSTASKAPVAPEASAAPKRATAPAEAVTWRNVVSCDVNGNTLTKTGNDGWTGGASSTFGLGGDGYAEFTVPAGAGYAMMGLGFGDASIDYPDIDYAFYTYPPTGQLYVFENGVFRGQFGAYTAGDKLRVAVEVFGVNYYRNGALVYTSAAAPIFPLRIKAAIYSIGAAVQDAVLAGTLVDLLTDRYLYPHLIHWQNTIGVAIPTFPTSAPYFYYPNQTGAIVKTAPTGWGNAGALSTPYLAAGDGSADFVVTYNPGFAMFGLSSSNTSGDYRDIDYAFYTYPPTGQINVFEKGEFRGQFGAYTPNDWLRIAIEGGVVNYYRNGTIVYTSAVAPTYPLRVSTAIYSTRSKVEVLAFDGDYIIGSDINPTMEDVAWQNMIGVYRPSNEDTLIKTASDGWNAGASSTRGLAAGDGYAEFCVYQGRLGFAMFGLSNGDVSVDYSDIDYAFYIYPPTGQLMVFESGMFRVQVGAFFSTTPYGQDFLGIAVESGVVHYYWNGVLVYRSTVAPTFPLRIDSALFSTGARIYANHLVGTLVDVTPALSCPGGHCSATSQACAYDKDCPTSGETCDWSPGTCSQSTAQSCLSDAGCPTGEACSSPRFVDNGNWTVTDKRTCLTWEKKSGTPGPYVSCTSATACPDPHDVNNRYAWSVGPPWDFDGPAATLFLTQINDAAFAGHTDWRLPTSAGSTAYPTGPTGQDPELESIMAAMYPNCTSNPCIDPVFGPTASNAYWTSSLSPAGPYYAWYGYFADGFVGDDSKGNDNYVRVLRSGP